jgi:uncharacterized protein
MRVRENGGAQTPQRWVYGGEGMDVILPRSPVESPSSRPHCRVALSRARQPVPRVRLGAIETLAEWLVDPDPARVAARRTVPAEIADQDTPSSIDCQTLPQSVLGQYSPPAQVHGAVPVPKPVKPSGDTDRDGFQEMELVGVRVEMPSNSPVVLLKEKKGNRFLPIWIGAVEATAIAFGQRGMVSVRPLTHDLFCDLLKAVNVRLLSARITSLIDGIFYTDLILSDGSIVSSRPSDAIAFAIRTGATVLISSEILAEIGTKIPDDPGELQAINTDVDKAKASARDSSPGQHSSLTMPEPRTSKVTQFELVGVRVEMPSNSPIVLLKEKKGNRFLPIWIGAVEATAIAFAQQGMVSVRPLTHDLFCDVLEAVNVRLLSARITSLIDGIFYTDLILSDGSIVSSRPSDAIALAIRTGAAIEVGTAIVDEVGVEIPNED